VRLPRFVASRLLGVVLTMVGAVSIVFVVSHLIPSDPARLIAGPDAREAQLRQVVAEYHLDRPLPQQYVAYLWAVFVRGDLGTSFYTKRSVAEDLRHYFMATLELVTAAMLIALVVGLGTGILAAVYPGGVLDHASRLVALSGVAIPLFWLGLTLQLVLGSAFGWLPINGRISPAVVAVSPLRSMTGLFLVDGLLTGNWPVLKSALLHLVLPAVTLSFAAVSQISRVMRASLLEVLREDYIRTARMKGLAPMVVILKHALRNASLPTLTVFSLSYSFLLGGAFLVEVVFDWPGMGNYAAGSLTALDFPAILGVTVLFALVRGVVNLVVDLVYYALDPRVAVGGAP
jgi:ABC-type dipeptide/oligopeptide/nickel transport system permease component